MSTLSPFQTKRIKELEYTKDDKKYKIELSKNANSAIITIKNINKIDYYYKYDISLEEIQNKNPMFRIYKTIDEFLNSLEGFIVNNHISIKEMNNNLILEIFIFNFMNGNKETINLVFSKVENTNKGEIIQILNLKVNALEEKIKILEKNNEKCMKCMALEEKCKILEKNNEKIMVLEEKIKLLEINDEKYMALEEKCNLLEKNYEKILAFVDPMIKEEEIEKKAYKFQWEYHDNCELSNNNKILKKIKNEGWNTNVKGNKILSKNSINVFKIKVNQINNDKSGLSFGISKASSNFTYENNWNMNCFSTTSSSGGNLKSLKSTSINKGDVVTFIVDLKDGTLEIKKNDEVLGKLNDIPKNEDLVPTVCNYHVGNEVEIID